VAGDSGKPGCGRILAAMIGLAALSSGATCAAETTLDAAGIRTLAATREDAAIALFREFLGLPNDAHDADDILRLVEWLEPQFESRGFTTRRIETGGSPALYAERRFSDANGTALIYLQADGQPVDPSKWEQADPYEATLKARDPSGAWRTIEWPSDSHHLDRDWRVFARSAADSKGPMTQFLVAIDALDEAEVAPPFNLKVIIDTEEELGSPHLAPALEAHRALLAADFLLVFDGPPHVSNRPTVTFGARGITTLTLATYGPRVPQHSGHYGNFLPNPAFELAHILASLKSPDGRVRVNGFYDGIAISDEIRGQLARVPDDEAGLLARMGVAEADTVAPSLQEALQYPSLNIRGLASGWVGDDARTIIPATAVAEIDIRTVVESDPERLVELVRKHIEALGYRVLDREPTQSERLGGSVVTMTHQVAYGAFRSDFDAGAGRVARAGMRRLYGEEPILIRTLGGSVPIAPFVRTLGVPAALVPTVNADNNQHSPNENLRVGDFFEGIAIMISVLLGDAR